MKDAKFFSCKFLEYSAKIFEFLFRNFGIDQINNGSFQNGYLVLGRKLYMDKICSAISTLLD